MTDRIRRMRERWETSTYPLCIDRMRASFPVMEAMKGQHPYKVRAAVHEAILTKCPIAIEPDDLICGVGAKEIVASTMGVLGGLEGLSPLTAYCFLLFVLLYFPCIATIVAIKHETGSWRWATFAAVYTTVVAWVVSAVVHQVGLLLNV